MSWNCNIKNKKQHRNATHPRTWCPTHSVVVMKQTTLHYTLWLAITQHKHTNKHTDTHTKTWRPCCVLNNGKKNAPPKTKGRTCLSEKQLFGTGDSQLTLPTKKQCRLCFAWPIQYDTAHTPFFFCFRQMRLLTDKRLVTTH